MSKKSPFPFCSGPSPMQEIMMSPLPKQWVVWGMDTPCLYTSEGSMIWKMKQLIIIYGPLSLKLYKGCRGSKCIFSLYWQTSKMKSFYNWTLMLAFFSLCFFINTSQGLYLTHALAGEVCAHEPTCLQNLPHLLKRFDYDRKLFLQRPTRNDRFVSHHQYLYYILTKTLKYFYHFSWMDSWIPTPFNLAERLIASLMKCFTSELLKKYKCIPNNSFYWLMVSLCYQWNTNLVNSGRQRVSSHINGINPATKQSGNN